MERLYKAVIAAAVIVFLGTFGALDTDSISVSQAMLQFTASALVGFVGGLLYRAERGRK